MVQQCRCQRLLIDFQTELSASVCVRVRVDDDILPSRMTESVGGVCGCL